MMSSTPTPSHTPPPVHYPDHGRSVGHRLHLGAIAAIIIVVVLIAAAVTAAIVLTATTNPPKPPRLLLPSGHATAAGPAAVGLAAADPVPIDQGISISLAPGWMLTDRGPNWVDLADPDDGAKMQVTIKHAAGTDVVAALQVDVNNWISAAAGTLTNVRMLGGPQTKTLQSNNFQQAAAQNYSADHSAMLTTTHMIGAFMELLNSSNGLSAFIEYRESVDSPAHAAAESQWMINSML